MVHYVRFLSPPRVLEDSKRCLEIHAVLALTTDLYDSYYPIDAGLQIRVLSADEHEDVFLAQTCRWKANSRALKICLQCNSKYAGKSVRLHVASLTEGTASAAALPVLLDVWSASFALIDKQRADPMVVRRMVLPNLSELTVWEETGESMARHVWDASLGFLSAFDQALKGKATKGAHHLHALLTHSSRTSPLRVVELGAGCGLVGIAFAQLAKSDVTLTDLDDASEILRTNIDAAVPLPGSTLRAEVLDWEVDSTDRFNAKYDVIIVSDCIYNPDSTPHLVETLHRLTRSCPEAVILVGFKRRHTADALFFQLMQQKEFQVLETLNIALPHTANSSEVSNPIVEFYTYRPPA